MKDAGGLKLDRLVLWLSLAVILTHALIPLGSPTVRGQGSAFSAYTADVSLRAREESGVKPSKAGQAPAGDPETEFPPGADSEPAGAALLPTALSAAPREVQLVPTTSAVPASWALHDTNRARAPPAADL